MSKPSVPQAPTHRLRSAVLGVAVGLGLLVIYSCSLIVETRDTQCQADTDCTSFSMEAHCDLTTHICVGPGSSSSSGTASSSSGGCNVDGGIDAGGCYACAPQNNNEFLNACSTGCIPFDNSSLKGLGAGGKLPDLPMPPPTNGM